MGRSFVKPRNRLSREKSPYLLQHAENPVDWYPWGEEAFAKARSENKPIFLSIGYSTCYWCHVMEKECFELEDVAEALNRSFVSVKVDREEHPDVDEIYMDAVMAMTGRGGWPMSVFLSPDLKPFWGATYIPRPHFLQLLGKISEFWQKEPAQLLAGGNGVMEALLERERQFGESQSIANEEIYKRFLQQAELSFDSRFGGFGGAPKFPGSMGLRTLLRLPGEKALQMAERSLEAMACGGIYDQLGGGFHRYSTDEQWLVPHFEKMLYDNALLATTYLEAFQKTQIPFYAEVARETLDYLLRDMRSPEGAFYSAEDAGEVSREGEFYVWKYPELQTQLGESFTPFQAAFPVSAEGNFEHADNIFFVKSAGDWMQSRAGSANGARKKLLEIRAGRPRPHRDEKILTAWNGLALAAFSLGAAVLEESRYLQAAQKLAGWMKDHLWDGRILHRRSIAGEVRYSGTAADYAYITDGLIALYQTDFDDSWLKWARQLQQVLDEKFWDTEKNGYFTASRDEANLVLRKKDRADGALPSPNSVAHQNLLRLGHYFLEPDLEAKANLLLDFERPLLERAPFGMATAIQAMILQEKNRILVLSGCSAEERGKLVRPLRKIFLPSLSLACADEHSTLPISSGKKSTECLAYLCENGVCLAPMDAKSALDRLRELPAS
jgi:uncharacterized protein YyaL (SSP411 family)